VLFGLNNVAAAASELQDHETAIELYRTVLDRHGRLFADTSQLVHVTWNNIGQLYHTMRQYEDAERAQREAIRIRRIALPPDHPSLALTLNNQGSTLERLGRLEEAESMHREVLDVFRRVYGPDHHRVGLSAYNLARVLRQTGKLVEAEELSRLTLRIDRATYGDDHPEIGVDLRGLAGILTERGNCEEAVATLREADSIFVLNAMPLTHRRRLLARADLGACLTTLGRRQEAESVLRASLAAVQASPDEADDDGASRIAERLIQLYESWGRPAAADSIRREATARSH
jgi:tetratricopeptide (TPR) repeat protein